MRPAETIYFFSMLYTHRGQFEKGRYWGCWKEPSTAKAQAWMPLRIVYVGESVCHTGWGREAGGSAVLSLQQIQEGNLKVEQEGRSGIANMGDVVVRDRATRTRFSTGPAGFCKKQYIGIEGDALDTIVQSLSLNTVLILKSDNPERFHGQIKELMELFRKPDKNSLIKIPSMALQVLMDLSSSVKSNPYLPGALQNAMACIRENLATNLRISEICRTACCSETKLLQLFKSHLNMTPVQYITDQRLRLGQNLLTTKRTVKEVSHLVGFQDPGHFSRLFKKRFGTLPSSARSESNIP